MATFRISLANRYECTGCMACADVCPNQAIKMVVEEDGHFYPRIDGAKCVLCGKCERLCEAIHKGYGTNNLSLSSPYVAWAKSDIYRLNGTSGGLFAAFAEKIIENGGVVFCSYFDGFKARHICVENVEDIATVQGSKYVQSDTTGIYKQIGNCLKNRVVLFCGLGCQVAAVNAFFKENPYRSKLYLIDMICAGVPSSLLIDKYRSLYPDCKKLISFRKKRKYELWGIVNNKEVHLKDKPLPLSGFGAGFTNRFSCHNCHFAYVHRFSDITIGDFWGDSYKDKQDKGISLMVVHNEKGGLFASTAAVECHRVEWEEVLTHNKRLYSGKRHISVLRKNLAKNSREWSDYKFNKVYSLNLKPSDGFWFMYKIYFVLKRYVYKFLASSNIKMNGNIR